MTDIYDFGFKDEMIPPGTSGIPARITAVHKERYEILCLHGSVSARLKAGIYHNRNSEVFPAVGDYVMIEYNSLGDSMITKTLGRHSVFMRSNFSGHGAGYVKTVKEQVIAANFDFVFILTSLNKELKPRRLERYVTLAWNSGAAPVIILTKSDLVKDPLEQIEESSSAAAGVPVFAVSSKTGSGLSQLSDFLEPRKTIVFLGSSGVGKSSLLNALADEQIMDTGDIREDDSRGRHTTAHRQLIMLPQGCMVIDTPGLREVGMWDADSGLDEAFHDVTRYFKDCRFSDCSHQNEPGCAVLEAIAEGALSQQRWEDYQKLLSETRFVNDKSGYLQSKREWHKAISKKVRQIKKQGKH